MTPADLQLVREASQRERAHVVPALFTPGGVICYCDQCKDDRETIAAAAPWLLAYVREAQAEPRRSHFDLGNLD